MCKKVPLGAIKLRAGDIASKTGRDRLAVTQDLLDAHVRHGVEIDHSDTETQSANLDFAGFDPNKTQPMEPFAPLSVE
ncbi:MAG: hypothetical protein PHD04_00010 [Candidatus Pacebacteria bacterium]|nr:hypothetical protein [Candidatus Paceibacterota bacterium]